MALHLIPRSLIYVEAVSEHGSIQAASRAIGVSASAIDRQIVLLEERAGVQLFERRTTGMALSAAGEVFVVLARRWRSDESRVWSDVKHLQGVDTGHIRIVTMDSLVNGPIPRFLARIGERYPRVRIDVEIASPDQAFTDLDTGVADIALAFNLRPHRDIHVIWSEELPLFCVVSPRHDLAGAKNTKLQEAIAYPLVLQSRSLAIRRILEARYAWLFSDNRPPVVTNSLQLLKHLVASGGHVALTSEFDAAQELLDGKLKAIPLVDLGLSVQNICVAISSRRTLPRICRIVMEELAAEMSTVLTEVRATT
ncbi:MAG: LysR family transcriptional regulator [Thalassospira sp.]|uniref:LysR family transcriptional regulator n=1 Tax=Thalassospira sp. TaxID=1912094 RepID=UPI0032EBF3CF